MKQFFIKAFLKLPDCTLKNNLKFLYFNLFKKNKFKISYRRKKFIVKFKNFTLIFNNDPYIELSIPTKGYLKKYKINKDDIVIDAGAYDGVFTIVAAKLVGKNGKVIAFEPDAQNYKMLAANIKLNNLNNVILINKGLWSDSTILKFKNIGSGIASVNHNGDISIPVVSLDEAIRQLRINRIDFIKMDIEGAELEALKGCENILQNNDVKLAIASYHIVNGKQTYIKLEKMLEEYGYRAETSYQLHLTTYANK